MLGVRQGGPFSKIELARHLDEKKIGNRMLFGGNLLRQPVMVQLKKDRPEAFRVAGEMTGADRIMNEVLFVGTYPGLTREMLDYVIDVIHQFCRGKKCTPRYLAIRSAEHRGLFLLPRVGPRNRAMRSAACSSCSLSRATFSWAASFWLINSHVIGTAAAEW